MSIIAYRVNGFTHNKQGGNPAGVVLNADNMPTAQMQAIAQRLGYSETAFVANDDTCDFHVRFFTPRNEVDFCGHATVATFALLFEKQLIRAQSYHQRTKAGNLAVKVFSDGLIQMNQVPPKFLATVEPHEIAPSLNLDANALAISHQPIEIVSTGLADIIIPVPLGTLDSITPNLGAIAEICQQYQAIGYHVFELPHQGSGITAQCRNFAPLVGINEESATGSACGALASYLFKHNIVKGQHFSFEQGRALNCLSSIKASIISDNNTISQVLVAGYAQLVAAITL